MATRTKPKDIEQTREMYSRRRFTAAEYHRMAETGILHEDDRVELIGGEIIEMNPIGSRHAACVRSLNRLLNQQVDDFLIDVQNPIRLDDHGEPQPDLAVVRSKDYRTSLPTPEDVLLVIEVSDTTLRYDREVKLPLYASFGIREVWIVDLASNVIERHTEPSGDGYRLVRRAGRGESLVSEVIPEIRISVDGILG